MPVFRSPRSLKSSAGAPLLWFAWQRANGHFALDDLRGAAESISRPVIQEGSPVNPPGIEQITSKNVN